MYKGTISNHCRVLTKEKEINFISGRFWLTQIVFGSHLFSNPDFTGSDLNSEPKHGSMGSGHLLHPRLRKGYTDYPVYKEQKYNIPKAG